MAYIEQQARDLVAKVTAGGPRMMSRDDAVRLVAAAMRAAPEAAQFAGWQMWDAASEAWESATEQRYSVVQRAPPEQARDVFTPPRSGHPDHRQAAARPASSCGRTSDARATRGGIRLTDEARLLTLTDGKSRVGISEATDYCKMAVGTSPKPAKVGARSLWPSPKIDDWIASVVESQSMEQGSQARKKPL